jgi:hypothetical protein
MFIEHMKKQGLMKALLHSDNAHVHSDVKTMDFLLRLTARLCGFIPSATGLQQPCDVRNLASSRPRFPRSYGGT